MNGKQERSFWAGQLCFYEAFVASHTSAAIALLSKVPPLCNVMRLHNAEA